MAGSAIIHNVLKKQKPSHKTENPIKFSLLNTRGLITGSEETNTYHNKSKFIHGINNEPGKDHIAATETFLNPDIGDGEILKSFPEYTLQRCDRDRNAGRKTIQGGCFLLTSPNISTTRVNSFSKSNRVCELLTTAHSARDLSILTMYRPPDTTLTEFTEILDLAEEHISSSKSSHYVLTGDFNFPPEIVTWSETCSELIPLPTPCRTADAKKQLQLLLEMADKHYMHQVVDVPTGEANTLDLLFTTDQVTSIP